MSELSMNHNPELDPFIHHNDTVCDFGCLIRELGAERCWRMLKESSPLEAEQLKVVANMPPQARLFMAPQ